ncbi:UPF0220-domain-containing protein [Nadsonia fulvescens var. elongata DSM 6958]|uniref:UPF0220-domain-containing protein n=1 Tax=Nadsonia fulvescens var. elongata DSM 6958 TaxID=857566 RepID=A0A1E3PIX8_9ASCO|nr:UPF0220-domain-containing protein [Nadsonia fulvescens var. elongata DSM 6958]
MFEEYNTSSSAFRLPFRLPKLSVSVFRTLGVYFSGALFGLGFYILLNASLYSHFLNGSNIHMRFFPDWMPLVLSIMGMIIINTIDKGHLQAALSSGDSILGGGAMGDGSGSERSIKIVLFMGFALLAGGVSGSVSVLVLKYIVAKANWQTLSMGIANVACNVCIMISCVILWACQNVEEEYSYSLAL